MANPPSMMGKLKARDLYNDRAQLQPITFIGPQFAYRTADGSGNNLDSSDLGKAGTPYARVAQQTKSLPRNQLPDAGLVFDTLLRRDKFRKHPGGLSSLMFSFAALVAYSVFRTDRRNVNINGTSGYLDLSPLYGSDQATQDKIRIKDGRGCLHPDALAEDRLLVLPPATMVILILFSRNHNYIARRILEINERGTWTDPTLLPPNSPSLLRQEEEIFQIARLCNCAWFAAAAFSDYFSAIVGLVQQGSASNAESLDNATPNNRAMEGGRGNARSVEFNCLYRWHVTTSAEDEGWLRFQFGQLFPGKVPEQITLADFVKTIAKIEAAEPDLQHWTFGSLQRQENGFFSDSELASMLKNSTSHRAASFGARGTPGIMRLYEIMGIETSRHWGVCSLNDFRRALGMKPYYSFYEWNPNATVAEAAERLYGEIDNLELYVGLQAEDTKPITEGFGLCSGYTVSHVVLSDLITLIRDDRFYTQDFTPYNMTSWGFADRQRDPSGWGFGSTLGRLLLRTLPNHYDEQSVYTWFPLMNPDTMQDYLRKHGNSGEYSCERPIQRIAPTTVRSYIEVDEILKDSQNFLPEFYRAKEIFGFIPVPLNDRSTFTNMFATSTDAINKIGQYFRKKTAELISTASYELISTDTRGVDVVRDVLRLVPLYWVASEFPYIPIGEKWSELDPYTPQQLYHILGDIYQFTFLDIEPGKYMALKKRVQDHVEKLTSRVNVTLSPNKAKKLADTAPEREKFLKHLFELGHTNEQVVVEILIVMAGISMEVSTALTNILSVLLDTQHFAHLRTLANRMEAQDHHTLVMYAIEALRIDPPFSGVYRVAKNNHDIGSMKVERGHRLFLNVSEAVMNEDVFPNPTTFDAMRQNPERHLQLDVVFKVINADFALELVVQVLRSIFTLDNVRRGPGQSARLIRFKDDTFRDLCYVYLDSQQHRSPWPTSLAILYNVPVSDSVSVEDISE